MKKLFLTISIFTLTAAFSFSHVNAQVQKSIDGIEITMSPENPAESQDVTISIESYLEDLDSSSMVWMVNGKVESRGVGVKSIKTLAPKTGRSATVSVVIMTNYGKKIEKGITIKSGSVDIVWESKGYTPPFFKGRNYFTYQNWIRLIAVPHLSLDGKSEVNPKDLVYKWKSGGKYIENGNGYGKQSVDIKADDLPKTLEISVEVYTKDQNQSAYGSLNINPTEPSIVFYEMNPLYGTLFNKALVDRYTLSSSEFGVFASPFGFNYNSKTNPLTYTWSINNVEQTNLSKNQSIVLKTKGDTDGSSDIDVDIKSDQEILQGARSSLRINFKKKTADENNVTF